MAHRFDIVAVGIAHKGSVVVGMVERPQLRLVKDVRACSGCCSKELAHRGTARGNKGNVAFAKTFTGLTRSDPELRLRTDAESHDIAEVHDAASAEWRQHLLIEGSARRRVGTLDGEMIDHVDIFAERADAVQGQSSSGSSD
jgi:hypothetical protein